MYKPVVVIPNHLPTMDFLTEWQELKPFDIIVVQDIGAKPQVPDGFNVTVYDHADIQADLGDDAWIIPTRSSACRSYGYYKAWQRKPAYIITLDNDCFPEKADYFVQGHHNALFESKATLDWTASNETVVHTRGYPYLIRNQTPVWLNHGLWSGVPDLDAASWLQNPDLVLPPYTESHVIPRHTFFPMCGMNLSWEVGLTPAMYFGIFGPDYGFDQYDDIWAGVLVKKVLDHLGKAARSGYPSVNHRKQSNVFVNLKKQAPGLAMNEHFWREVQAIQLTGSTVVDCYEELIAKLPDSIQDEPTGWTRKFKEAALIWVNLFRSNG